MNTKVSVIIPVYNVEKYLKKALDSMRSQTLKEMEFICINDGSKDKSLEILKDYALKDSRFKIINQTNKGSGAARNAGMKLVSGEYTAFLDPDDWVEPESMELLYNQAKAQDTDMLVFGYNVVDENSGDLIKIDLKDNLKDEYQADSDKTFNWKDIKSKIFGGLFYASWNKLYKSDFLRKNKIFFTDCSMSEDNAFVFASTLKANKIGYNDKVYYNYLMRANSAVHRVTDKNFCIFKVCDAVKKLLEQCGLKEVLSKEFDDYIIDTIHYHYKKVKSRDLYSKKCSERFTPEQRNGIAQKISEQNAVFNKISEIIAGLKKG